MKKTAGRQVCHYNFVREYICHHHYCHHEQPMTEATRICIVGGGFAGALTEIKLIQATSQPLALNVIGSDPETWWKPNLMFRRHCLQ